MQKSHSIVILIMVLLITAAAALPSYALMLVSRSMEVSVGKQVQQDVIRQYGGLSTDPIATQRVARIGRQVAAVSPRRDVTYTYQVLNSNIINAFAAPGGPVLITKRLVDMLTDSQLAFVLAHETGHIAAQHGRDAINRALLAQGIGSLLFGSSSSAITQGVNIMYTLYNRGYSRSQEYQADTYGVQIMAGAGYNQEAAIEALAKLGMQRTGGINRYLSTHPDVPDRINRVASLIGISQAREQQLIRQAQAQPGAR